MILIVGATGCLGSAAARRLLASGERVRAMTRSPARARELEALGAEVVTGDLRDEVSLRNACSGAERVLAAAHALMGRGKESSRYIDDIGHRRLIDIAKAAGVQHFVYASAFGASAQHPAEFARIKAGIEQYLKRSGLSYTILRPTNFMEWHAYNFIGKPILERGKVTLLGPGENPINFVAADDVARFAVLALTDAKAVGQAIEIGGFDNRSKMEVVQLYEQLSGRKAKVTKLPLALLRIMSPLLRPFQPGLSQVFAFTVWSETSDFTFDPSEMLKEFPLPLTRLEPWVEATVAEFNAASAGMAAA